MAISALKTDILTSTLPIRNSMQRILCNFQGRDQLFRSHPIYEGATEIGVIQQIANNHIAITFRGSLGIFEFLSCAPLYGKVSCKKAKLPGKMHAGIYATFLAIRDPLLQIVLQCIPKNSSIKNKITITIEGHSRGAMIAIAVAAFLSKKFSNLERVSLSLFLLTYSATSILDKEAAEEFERLVPNHFDFVAKEDFVPDIFDRFGYYRVGKKISFSAELSPFYRKYTKNKEFPYFIFNHWLVNNLVNTLFLSSKSWTAHMPNTYLEGAPIAFALEQYSRLSSK